VSTGNCDLKLGLLKIDFCFKTRFYNSQSTRNLKIIIINRAPVAEWSKVLGFYRFATSAPGSNLVRPGKNFPSNIWSSRVYQHHSEFSVFDWRAFSESVDLSQNALHRIQLHYYRIQKYVHLHIFKKKKKSTIIFLQQ
jgi:hypothetical protein